MLWRSGSRVQAFDGVLIDFGLGQLAQEERLAMTLFFLHQRRPSDYINDLEGCDFASLEDARSEAIEAAREILQQMIGTGVLDLTGSVEIEGPDGATHIVRFSEAVELRQ
jgi:hypothetical protein